MSQTPSISGPGRGRARGRGDIVEGESSTERRPGRSRVDDWESELEGSQSDMESNWKSRTDSASEPVIGYTVTDYSSTSHHDGPRAGSFQSG